jgi:predicted PurR-regulated permease PerM
MNGNELPTPWQRKTLWNAVTAIAVVAIGGIAVGLIWLVSRVLGFLQPILIPFAVAAVMAYLLEPVVERIQRWGTTRRRAVATVFTVLSIAVAGILLWIVPALAHQTDNIVQKVPGYSQRLKNMVMDAAHKFEAKTGFKVLPEMLAGESGAAGMGEVRQAESSGAEKEPATETSDATPAGTPTGETPEVGKGGDIHLDWLQLGKWAQTTYPVILRNFWHFITTSVGGFLGVFGFLLSLVIVPVYLWYFLIESRNIALSWGDYLPLTKSAFKDEVVSALGEINGYLIAFFRGQLLVSMINGTATGILLVAVGLDFGLLIGLMLCFLGLIPYLGIIMCWLPAVIIASVQGDAGTWIPGDPWWLLPLVVTGIFVVVQQIDGLFITPKIVGESVGLHPMTVIVSVFVWTLLMGGLLGAILAVPMTATVKVLLRRYVWEKRILAEQQRGVTEETAAIERAASPHDAELVRAK